MEALDYLLGAGAYAGRDASRKPALIVLDLNLPRISGMQVMERLNREWGAGLGDVKVAILSSSYREEERLLIRKLGAALHMRKPLRPDETAAMIRDIGQLLLSDG